MARRKKKAAGGLWTTLALIIGVAVVALGGRYVLLSGAPVGPGGEAAAPAALGGPFALVRHDGKPVTDADFKGRYMLLYFGYTFCPDVCPTSLGTMAQAMAALPPDKAERIVPVFISVDPERDTPDKMAEYVKVFDPRLVGLSGTPEQVAAAAKAYRVYYAKVEDKDGGPYLMDHSSVVYLMGPDGAFVTHFNHGTAAPAMAERLAALVK